MASSRARDTCAPSPTAAGCRGPLAALLPPHPRHTWHPSALFQARSTLPLPLLRNKSPKQQSRHATAPTRATAATTDQVRSTPAVRNMNSIYIPQMGPGAPRQGNTPLAGHPPRGPQCTHAHPSHPLSQPHSLAHQPHSLAHEPAACTSKRQHALLQKPVSWER